MNAKAAVLALVAVAGGSVVVLGQTLPKPAWVSFEAGGFRLEGDQRSPTLGPYLGVGIGYDFTPYAGISLVSGGGWSGGNTPEVPKWDQTLIGRAGAEVHLKFAPLAKLCPFVSAGAGIVYWDARDRNGNTVSLNGNLQSSVDPYIQTGGGVEMRFSPKLSLTVGFRFEYNFTDAMDVRTTGSENDQTMSGFVGLAFHFGRWFADDRDDDGVPAALDLQPAVPEDADGYMDHDGAPEPDALLPIPLGYQDNPEPDRTPPVVIHYPVRLAIAGQPVGIRAEVYEDRSVKVVALLYRRVGHKNWTPVRMVQTTANVYEATIPGENVRFPGVEYCVVAVDQALSGLGYSGMLDRPNLVRILPRGLGWRIAGGLTALVGWGAAGYLLWNRQ